MADTTASAGANCMDKLKSYVRTQKGFILAAEILISLIVIICYAASLYGGYSAVAICEMIFAMVFFGIFMMEMDKQIQVINWVWTDLFRAGIGAVLYIITSLICVIGGAGDGARIAGGVFGLIAGLLFAYDTYTIFLQIKSTRQHTAASTGESNTSQQENKEEFAQRLTEEQMGREDDGQ
ncbi:Proteolipid protein 2 [Collichthys lucidus]|uniref:Proteolipid protein 2 n=1 Tax=Collichthys lucidus TaxID=240159 RepID=A0A4U5UPB4_COLLU|nr:Proteolipid protein 2 [Collichthys lucidus]